MADFSRDKHVERDRYDERARKTLAQSEAVLFSSNGAGGVPEELRQPYLIYEQYIRQFVRPGSSVLDVCCGNGQHSLTAATAGAVVTVSDIAPYNVELTQRRATQAGLKIQGLAADAEKLPWPEHSFDMVTCAGSLSYVDHLTFFQEVNRVLRPGGVFICVDSLNHNFIYRFNRFLHYVRGQRTLSTLKRMPNMATLNLLKRVVGPCETSFHGIFSFLAPILRLLLGPARTAKVIAFFDQNLPFFRRYAFKFVACVRRPI